jgi:predicted ATPase
MFTHLRLKNFKAWQDTGDVKLAPLTVFFGANSSGKSSIYQFLLMLKQTAQSPDRKRVLNPGDAKSPIDLGAYRDMVFDHNIEKNIVFEVAWSLSKRLELKDVYNNRTFSGNTIIFSAEVGLTDKTRENVVVHKMLYRLGNPLDDGCELGLNRTDAAKDKYDIQFQNYNPVRKPGRPWKLPAPLHFHRFPDETTAYFQNADFVQDLTLSLDNQLSNLYYLGPLRERPQRSYAWSGEVPEHVGWNGERAIDAILSAQDERMISPRKYYKYLQFDVVIARWLRDMGLIESFEVARITPDGVDYRVWVEAPHGRKRVLITDVGFGVSQILPVLVQCFYAPPDSTIILEQPEIHLHPSVQSWLADLFIEAVQSQELRKNWGGGRKRNIQLLVESHSEHFLRRLQRRIAEGMISPDETALYFCESKPSGSLIKPLEVDLYGNILNWPENFFGDSIEDLSEMTKAAIRRSTSGK